MPCQLLARCHSAQPVHKIPRDGSGHRLHVSMMLTLGYLCFLAQKNAHAVNVPNSISQRCCNCLVHDLICRLEGPEPNEWNPVAGC